jgi:hypothetical protein
MRSHPQCRAASSAAANRARATPRPLFSAWTTRAVLRTKAPPSAKRGIRCRTIKPAPSSETNTRSSGPSAARRPSTASSDAGYPSSPSKPAMTRASPLLRLAHVFDVVWKPQPRMLPLLPDRPRRRREGRIRERAYRDGHNSRRGLRGVEHGRAAVWTEVEAARFPVGYVNPSGGSKRLVAGSRP